MKISDNILEGIKKELFLQSEFSKSTLQIKILTNEKDISTIKQEAQK